MKAILSSLGPADLIPLDDVVQTEIGLQQLSERKIGAVREFA